MKAWACILALTLGLAACGPMAPKNPLGPSLAPTPSVYQCPARYNFESPTSLAPWQAPSWGGGFGPMSLDGTHTACGKGALKVTFAMNGSNRGVLFTVFPHGEDVTGHTLVANFYFAVPPPSDLNVVLFFMDRNGNWLNPSIANHYGMRPGWNQISENFTMAGVTDVIGLVIQFATNNGVTYAGDLWVDEINW
jgi:hypothetical protein